MWSTEDKMRRSGGTKKLKTDDEDASSQPGTSKQKSQEVAVAKNERNCSSSVSRVAPVVTTSPLDNPAVLGHVFKFCDAKLLANCRLVCKQWYQESLQIWRTDFPITFTKDKKDNYKLVLVNHEQLRGAFGKSLTVDVGLQEFLDYCGAPENGCTTSPYRSVKLRSPPYKWNTSNAEVFGRFWGALGANLTSLHLFECGFGAEEFQTTIFAACPNLQNLKVDKCHFSGLNFVYCETHRYSDPPLGKHAHLKSLLIRLSPLPITWLEMFSHLQSLSHFTLEYYHEHFRFKEDFIKAMSAMQAVRRHDPDALPFKSVRTIPALNISESSKETGLAKRLRLPIRSLQIHLHPEMDVKRVKTALKFHEKTVREIKLSGTTGGTGQPFPFKVRLDNLTSLEIGKEQCETGSLVLLKYTPNLTRLVLSGDDDATETIKIIGNSSEQEMGNMRMAYLTGLRVKSPVTEQDLLSLFEWMPNVTRLEMTLDDKQFGRVCENWKNLTSLKVRGTGLTWAGVTGLGTLGEKSKEGKKKIDPNGAARPNITYLQNLEEFGCQGNQLAVEAVFHGFLLLPRLRKLEFWKNHNVRWGKDARKALENKRIELCESKDYRGWGRGTVPLMVPVCR